MERDAEMAAVDALLDAAGRADGRVLVVEGPAGIGKTALAHAARSRARERGMAVLGAAGSDLDADFAFGVVLQLLGPPLAAAEAGERAALLAGAAALAQPVIEGRAAAPAGPDATHAVLHGLYWLTVNLAERAPLLLLVDDMHWCDAASLRYLEFLGRRLEGLPVLVLATARPEAPADRAPLLAALAEGPAARVLRPAPLGSRGTAAVLERAVGAAPDPAFADAVRDATGGNPLLVGELARAAADGGMTGRGDEAASVAALAADGLSARVGRRLGALGEGARALARAAAVLGPRASLHDLATLAGLDEDAAVAGADRLAAAQILEPATRAFVHPLVREATLAGIPPAEGAGLHARAARLLAAHGRPAEVAAHLMRAEPAGDPWVVDALCDAARAAAAEGAGDAALGYLRRALAEPPAPARRAGVLLELAELEVAAGDPAAGGRVRAALAAGPEGDAAARAHAARARLLLLADPSGAVDELERASAAVRDEALARRLRSGLFTAAFYDAALDARRPAMLADAARAHPDSPIVAAHLAIEAAYAGGPAAEVAAQARRALDGGGLLAEAGLLTGSYHLLVLALRLAEERDLAAEALDAGDEERRRSGSRLGQLYMDHGRAYWAWSFGSLAAAEAHARAALAAAEEIGLALARTSLQTILAEVLVARGAVDEAAALVDAMVVTEAVERTIAGTDALAARAWVRAAQGRTDEAEAELRRARGLLAERGWHAPHKARATLRLAELLSARDDDRTEALALADESLAAARAAGLRGAEGVALRMRGRALRGEDGIGELRAAVSVLEGGRLAIDLAWALFDLGAAERRAGHRRDARASLRRALDAAVRLGAGRLADLAREELAASGARVRSEALDGIAALTPAELRVAELAARGLSNRRIAESLWVTRKTVEVHLGRCYAKLGIRSRSQLADALADGVPAAGDGGREAEAASAPG